MPGISSVFMDEEVLGPDWAQDEQGEDELGLISCHHAGSSWNLGLTQA